MLDWSRKDISEVDRKLFPAYDKKLNMSPAEPTLQVWPEVDSKEYRPAGGSSTRAKLHWILTIALALRLIVSLCVVGDLTDPGREHWHFGYETGRVARSLATGHGFGNPLYAPSGPTAWLAPIYPGILAAIFKLLGVYSAASAIAILTFNSLVSALTCVPIFFAARRCFDERTAWFAGWLWALFPVSVYMAANWVWDSCLSLLIFTTLVWLALEFSEPKPLVAWIGYGGLWGLAALTNPTLLAALPFLLGWNLYQSHRSGHRFALKAAAPALACIAVMSPWLVRNYSVFHEFVFVKDNLWLEVKVGNNPTQLHWWNEDAHPSRNMGELGELIRQGEASYMAEKKQQSLEFIEHHFASYLWLCFRRFIYWWTGFWSFRISYLVTEPMDPVNIVFSCLLTIAAVLGLRRAFLNRSDVLIPHAAILLSVPFIFYLTHPFPTYRHLIDSELVLLGAYGSLPRLSLAWREFAERLQFGGALGYLIPRLAGRSAFADWLPSRSALARGLRMLPLAEYRVEYAESEESRPAGTRLSEEGDGSFATSTPWPEFPEEDA